MRGFEVGIPELHDSEGGGEDAGLHNLYLRPAPHRPLIPPIFRKLFIYFLQCFRQLASDAHPFRGFEVVVLKDDY